MKAKLIAAGIIAMLPLIGFAEDGAKTPTATAAKGVPFETLDTNKDGKISMSEAAADPALAGNFAKVDQNGDGYIDSAEFSKSTAPQQQ